ncbi:SDR family NAD(P)-dependent oxidoreductase [Floccifex sp.]|uniref:SDR family NAD(P)-dependent oxidoreductase n=1 Tax=Floccifex sp. TaxID=2815810 RepID=UPI003F083BE6
MDLGLKGKVVLVTGSSRGIGAGTCEVFAQEGCNVIINYVHSKQRAQELALRLENTYGIHAIAIQADMNSEEDILRLFNLSLQEMKKIDILVNNVNELNDSNGPIEQFSVEKFRGAEAGSIESMMICCREFVKHCKEQKKPGHIVNVLTKSIFWTGSYHNLAYVTVKGANASFTRGLAHDVIRDGIHVNAVVPGYVINDRTNPNSARYQKAISHIPFKEYAKPEEIGNCIAFLCSDKAFQCNGAILDCSGSTLLGDV